jgi:hypothetical protein
MILVAVALRLIVFSLLPVLLGVLVATFDGECSSRRRRLEVMLVFLFSISVAGSGIFNFVGHFFLSGAVAESIGWEAGGPFELEVGFANLALGILGLVATSRRDGFREATVIAVTVFGVGATIVHVMDIAASGNLAPGNTIQNVSNLLRPALLVGLLVASRRADTVLEPMVAESSFEGWRLSLARVSAPITACVATAHSLGYAFDRPWLFNLLGLIVALGVLMIVLARSPLHKIGRAGKNDLPSGRADT